MARMLGRMHPPQCLICRRPPGPCCPDEGKDARQAKRAEKQALAAELDALVREAVALGLYESTARPVETR